MNGLAEGWSVYYEELCAMLMRLMPIDGVFSFFVDAQGQAYDYRFDGMPMPMMVDYLNYAQGHDPVHYRHFYHRPEVAMATLSQTHADAVYATFLHKHEARDSVELFFREQGRPFFCMSLIRKLDQPAFWSHELTLLQAFQQVTELSLRHMPLLPSRSRPQVAWFDYGLTKKEWAILQLVCQGLSHKAIAAQSFCSIETVKTHIRHLLRKTQTRSKHELMHLFLHQALPTPPHVTRVAAGVNHLEP